MDNLEFDIFCCHNSLDKPEIEVIISKLKQRNISSWLDTQQILAGQTFQKEIQKAIPKIRSAVIFYGKNGLGHWQKKEIDFFLSECDRLDKPIILVLLHGIKEPPEELGFLLPRHWICFEAVDHQSLDKLEASIKGYKPIKPFFDVLLCYREEDTKEIREIERYLLEANIKCWQSGLCVPNMTGGELDKLDEQFNRIWSMVVFVGNKVAPWKNRIIRDFIKDFRGDDRNVIPVFLENVEEEPDLPCYLKVGKVDFRRKDIDPIKELIAGIMKSDEY